MSVTEREVPYEVASKSGGFPTKEEFDGVYAALLDVDEFGLRPLLSRIARPLAEAYESEHGKVEFTSADLGLLYAKAHLLARTAENVAELAKNLHAITEDVAEALELGGEVDHAPMFDASGWGKYEPSREALERWGLVKPKADDAR
jgi:hypothetical protein